MKQITRILLPALVLAGFTFSSCKKENTTSQKTHAITGTTDDATLQGLVAWYTFNGDVLDHTSFHNDVVFNNATPTAGKDGQPNTAYLFNGTDNFMQVANSFSLNLRKEITLFALLRVDGFYDGTCHGNQVLVKGNDVKGYGVYSLAFDDARFYNYAQCAQAVQPTHQNFFARYGDENGLGTSAGADAPNYLKAGRWYAVAYTYADGVSKLYINGTLVNTQTKTASFTNSASDLFIGKLNTPGYPYWFHGAIDEIRLYKKALAPAEVAQLAGN